MEIMKLFMTKDEDLYDKKIEDVFDEEVFDSTFWLYWRAMFAFENWHSALEMKLYFQRFIHHIAGLPDFSALKFTKYNQYESLILPMQKYLEEAGVDFSVWHRSPTDQIANLADTPRDTVFTTEYSVRTAMEAVYGLFGVDRGVPEVWGSVYDIRELLDSSVKLMDGRSPLEIPLPGPLNALKKPLIRVIRGTVIEKLLRDHDILREEML